VLARLVGLRLTECTVVILMLRYGRIRNKNCFWSMGCVFLQLQMLVLLSLYGIKLLVHFQMKMKRKLKLQNWFEGSIWPLFASPLLSTSLIILTGVLSQMSVCVGGKHVIGSRQLSLSGIDYVYLYFFSMVVALQHEHSHYSANPPFPLRKCQQVELTASPSCRFRSSKDCLLTCFGLKITLFLPINDSLCCTFFLFPTESIPQLWSSTS
jgi:hypothetical protein